MEPFLHCDDIVAFKSDGRLATVERAHDDFEPREEPPYSFDSVGPGIDELNQEYFINLGLPTKDTVLLRFANGRSTLVRTDTVVLAVRSLLIGDIVKRSPSDAQSGVVINTSTKCALQPLCQITHDNDRTIPGFLASGESSHVNRHHFSVKPEGQPPLIRDVPASELKYSHAFCDLVPGDLVIYRDWMGKLTDKTDLITVRLSDGGVVEISGEQAEQIDGDSDSFLVGDIVLAKKGILRQGKWIFGRYNPNTPPVGTVVDVRPQYMELQWLQKRIGSTEDEPSEMFDDAEWESSDFQAYDRTRRPASFPDLLGSSRELLSSSEIDLRLGQRVRFHDMDAACLKYNTAENPTAVKRHDRKDNMGYDLNVFDVVSLKTEVTVQWQDLSMSTHNSVDLVPDSGIDDNHAAWPGEITHTLAMEMVPGVDNMDRPERVGVVHMVNAAERMAQVSWNPESFVEYARSDPSDAQGEDSIVRYRIAVTPGEVGEISLYDIDTPAQLNVRRGDIVLIDHPAYNPRSVAPSDQTWLGEIVDTPLDGSLVIRLGAANNVQDVVLRREEATVAVRSDGSDEFDHAEDVGSDNNSDMMSIVEELIEQGIHPSQIREHLGDFTAAQLAHARFEDEDGNPLEISEIEDDAWESADDEADDRDIEMADDIDDSATIPSMSAPASTSDTNPASLHDAQGSSAKNDPLPYLVLETPVPLSHHFVNNTSSSSAAYLKRVQKEHKILGKPSSLPDGVFVRSWESRLDLLRVLILGPADTPYANAPFLVDVFLPVGYPAVPPKVHFHSWLPEAVSGTHGRLNPNMYEDGTICLSLLGTWEGAPGEGWSPTGSTILQVIVSILGLVLVREPYFNEAGYETFVGTEEAKVPSTMYSERVFLRSKGLIITALAALSGERRLEAPGLEDFEEILRWAYLATDGPKLLQSTITNIDGVLQRSDGIRKSDGLTAMSKGACIPLKRVLDRLKQLVM